MDRLTPEERSRNMSRIRSKDTLPEILVRRILHRLGYRFRLHRRDLPGSPDIVLPGRRTVIFVHGCFWHRHPDCRNASTPKTRTAFWEEKFRRNVERDAHKEFELRNAGWHVATVWECETQDTDTLAERLVAEIAPPVRPKH